MLHQIGIGTLGPVFRTYEPTRDRLVAVKVFRLDIVPEQAQSLAVALGRAAQSSLFHPSIVEPIASGVEGTLAYRAEEYVAAESLDVAMRHYAPASIDKALPFITQLAGAIDFARAAGIGHGGLHPRDIFVTPDEARATGFGVIEALEQVGIRAPVRRPYTAPERIEGKPWSTPADIFSLAAIAFELLTGRRPAGTGAQIGALPDAETSDALHTVLARAMHEDPSQRYPTALSFASALEAAGRPKPQAAQPVPPVATVAPTAAAAAAATAAATAPVTPPAPSPGEFGVEKQLDPVHAAIEDAAEEQPEPSLFDVDDEPGVEARVDGRFADDFRADEDEKEAFERRPLEASFETAQPVATSHEREDVEPIIYHPPDTSRPAVLPIAIAVVLALLAGFAGGYFMGSRDRIPTEQTTSTPATSSAPSSTSTAVPYSDQKVSSAPASPAPTAASPSEPKTAEAPPVVSETEPARRTATSKSAPPAAAAPRTERTTSGSMIVKSQPSRAGVTVNGNWRGRTPLTLEHLTFGKYVVRIVQPGYRVAQEEFTLNAREPSHTFSPRLDRTQAVHAAPEEAPPPPAGGFTGSLYVDSRPRGATVLVDGKSIGQTPISVSEIKIGSHVVRVEMAGKKPWASSANITAGQTTRVTMSLEDK